MTPLILYRAYTVPKNASVDPRIHFKCQCRGLVTWLKAEKTVRSDQTGRSHELKRVHCPWTLEKVWDRPINDFSVEPANIWEFEEFFNIFSMIKPLIRTKILAHNRSYPFVSFHFPWNDDAMVEVFLESLELWISTAVDQMLGSKKIQMLFYAQKSWFLFNKTMCHSQKAYWKTVFKNHSLRQSLRPVSASFWTNGRPFSAWLSEFANIIPSS